MYDLGGKLLNGFKGCIESFWLSNVYMDSVMKKVKGE